MAGNSQRQREVLFQHANEPTRLFTFSSLKDAALRFAWGLHQQFNIRKGDVIGLFAVNDIDVVPVIFGTLACGGIISPTNPAFTASELAHQLLDSDTRLLITDLSTLPVAEEACKSARIPQERIILLGTKPAGSQGKYRHWTEICLNTIKNPFPPYTVAINPKTDVAFIVYSSGTTGKPKGVMLTHFNITSNIEQIQVFELISWDGSKSVAGIPNAPKGTGDKILATLPFFHVYGLTALIINPIYTGVCCVVARAAFDFENWCQSVERYQITIAYLVPPQVILLAKNPIAEKYNLSSIRVATSGAAPLSKELVHQVFRRLGIRIKQGYGLSETSPTLFTMRWCDWDKKSGSAGWLVPNAMVKFCQVLGPDDDDDDDPCSAAAVQELSKGEVGEVYVKGPNVFKGYLNNPQATAASFHDDGWFRTGDVGYMDEDGDLFITDRAKELIKYKGFQVAPAELEGYLLEHDLVDDVAVIGVSKPELGTEVPRAYVVPKGGMEAVGHDDDQKIIDWLSLRVVNYKRLRGGVRFVESIPKSGSGKILRRVLRDEIREEALQQHNPVISVDQKPGIKDRSSKL